MTSGGYLLNSKDGVTVDSKSGRKQTKWKGGKDRSNGCCFGERVPRLKEGRERRRERKERKKGRKSGAANK